MYKDTHMLRNQKLNVSIAEPKPGARGSGSSTRSSDYTRHSPYQGTPTHVYAYSLLPHSSSAHSSTATYVPTAAQYYAYQSAAANSGSGQYQGQHYAQQYSTQYGASNTGNYGNSYN